MDGPYLVLLCSDPVNRDPLIKLFDQLRDQFENLSITGLDPSKISADIEKVADAIVLDIEQWSHADEMIIAGLRGTGYKGPVLIVAKKEPTDVLPTTRIFDKVAFLAKPCDPKELVGIIRRMLLAPIIAARKFTRHETNERADLQIEGQTMFHSCRVKNMSKGGAYLEFARPLHVRIGDVVILRVH